MTVFVASWGVNVGNVRQLPMQPARQINSNSSRFRATASLPAAFGGKADQRPLGPGSHQFSLSAGSLRRAAIASTAALSTHCSVVGA